MRRHKGITRRRLLLSSPGAALAAAGLSVAGYGAGAGKTPGSRGAKAAELASYQRDQLFRPGAPREFSGAHLSEIAFPLGGIGTGTVSLGGRGQLRDWEIFNRPAKSRSLPFTFAALWARQRDRAPIVRILEGALPPPYSGGFGYSEEFAPGFPRMKGARFTGAYPFAQVAFEDESLPLEISLEAFNPLIPLNVDDSALPVAVFRYHLISRSRDAVDVAIAFSILNPVGWDGATRLNSERYRDFGRNVTKVRRERLAPAIEIAGLEMSSERYGAGHPRYGSIALVTTTRELSARLWTQSNPWRGLLEEWLADFAPDGQLRGELSAGPSEGGRSHYGTLAPRVRVEPGERKSIVFLLAWYFPVRENYWNRGDWGTDEWEVEQGVESPNLRNDYGNRFTSAWEVGRYTAANLNRLENTTRKFQTALFSSSLPNYVLDAVSSQVSTLRTNTCILLEGKQFFAFEGCGDDAGSAPMNCTHVWNYEQTLAFLFPELERSMRLTDFSRSMLPDGSMAYRALVPGVRAKWKYKPAADGQMGCILKLFREWQISGDDDFLQRLWPQAKRSLEYAWVQWDRDRDGVMEGEQRNTYDTQLYGPNTMMGTLYLGALKAGELMALAVGEKDAAEVYRRIHESGRRKLEDLWNGEYYIQKVPSLNEIENVERSWNENWRAAAIQFGQIPFQYGEGCLSDQLLGQWFAHVVGLGYLLSPARIRKALLSIYRYNHKQNFYDHINAQRVYALNEEKGLLLCTWPKGNRPALPTNYCDEVWTGIEYQVAAHLIYEGCVEEGLSIVKSVRDRYDGLRRNPWNEVEFGSHYARALASWSVLLALSGYRYSAAERSLQFAPKINRDKFRCFFSTSSGWGVFHHHAEEHRLAVRLEIEYGAVCIRTLKVANRSDRASAALTWARGAQGKILESARSRGEGDDLLIDFGEEVTVPQGESIEVKLLSH